MDDLTKELLAREMPEPPPAPRSVMPRPAGKYPVLERAIDTMMKQYPDMRNADIQPMPWDSNHAFSNILGETGLNSGAIKINPVLPMWFPQRGSEETLAHEFQHVRQHRASKDPDHGVHEFLLPYEERPSEIEAQKAADDYRALKGYPSSIKASKPDFDLVPTPMGVFKQRQEKKNGK